MPTLIVPELFIPVTEAKVIPVVAVVLTIAAERVVSRPLDFCKAAAPVVGKSEGYL